MTGRATSAAAAAELAAIRARLIAQLRGVIGPAITDQQAQGLLERALVWSPRGARRLAAHLADNPTAFSTPSPHCPASLPRLLRLLHAGGHGHAVTLLACVHCGSTNRTLGRLTEQGRCCSLCLEGRPRRCARCGQDRRIVARREEGPICQRCYAREPGFRKECAGCGHRRPARVRREDGAPLCWACAPAPARECVRCAQMQPPQAYTDAGPVCRGCYTAPPGLCGICGELATIQHRGGEGRPPSCTRCYRNLGECVVCRRVRKGSKLRGGEFHCASCRPHRPGRCALCQQMRRVRVIWPLGTVCNTCYQRRHHHPSPCAQCGTTRVLIGHDDNSRDVCGSCCGADKTYDCRRCGQPGQLHSHGACARCVAHDRVYELLSADDGHVVPRLLPLADALIAAHPYSTLSWLVTSPGATLLAGLVAQHTDITHELLDQLPQNPTTGYIREILVTAAILQPRHEHFHQLRLWASTTAATLPAHQRTLIAPFAEWQIVRDARRRAARGRYSYGAGATDRRDIRTAIAFLDWLDTIEGSLARLTQGQLELWLEANPAGHRHIIAFLRWAVARRLTGPLEVPPRRPNSPPSRFISNDELREQLRRCLNDTTLPLEVRIIGALVRLYAFPVIRILELTTDRFHRDDSGAYLTVGANPVLLPPKLAGLIEEQIARPHRFTESRSSGTKPAYLLPGHPPSRPRNAAGITQLMTRYDMPSTPARHTAMIEAVSELPPIVVSDLFGIAPKTAHAWARLAQHAWTDYLDTQT